MELHNHYYTLVTFIVAGAFVHIFEGIGRFMVHFQAMKIDGKKFFDLRQVFYSTFLILVLLQYWQAFGEIIKAESLQVDTNVNAKGRMDFYNFVLMTIPVAIMYLFSYILFPKKDSLSSYHYRLSIYFDAKRYQIFSFILFDVVFLWWLSYNDPTLSNRGYDGIFIGYRTVYCLALILAIIFTWKKNALDQGYIPKFEEYDPKFDKILNESNYRRYWDWIIIGLGIGMAIVFSIIVSFMNN